jgi:hypothetical protein
MAQQGRHLLVLLGLRPVKRGHLVLVHELQIGIASDERSGDLQVASVGSAVQRGVRVL